MKSIFLCILVTLATVLIFSENANAAAAEPEIQQILSNNEENESREPSPLSKMLRVRRAPAPKPQGNLRSVHITPGGTYIRPDGNPNVYLHGNPYRYSAKCRAYGIGCGK